MKLEPGDREGGLGLRYIENGSEDVYFNLALEDYLLQNFREGTYLLLWRNDRSIVLGKYQNVYEEVNLRAVEDAGIKVARRNSGGGTVYHDLGNLNYSILTDYDPNGSISYDLFLEPMISALRSMGIPAEKRGASDIAIRGMKISGSAQTLKKGRVLHHGTLLFDADLSSLHDLLKTTAGTITSRAVKSVRSPVTNIRAHLEGTDLDFKDFRDRLLENLQSTGMDRTVLTEEQLSEIRRISEEKYSTWEWNFGRSPSFDFEKAETVFGGNLRVRLRVEDGIIISCRTEGCHFCEGELENVLKGSRYSCREVSERLKVSHGRRLTALGLSLFTACFF